jgi:hypothetical protein
MGTSGQDGSVRALEEMKVGRRGDEVTKRKGGKG